MNRKYLTLYLYLLLQTPLCHVFDNTSGDRRRSPTWGAAIESANVASGECKITAEERKERTPKLYAREA